MKLHSFFVAYFGATILTPVLSLSHVQENQALAKRQSINSTIDEILTDIEKAFESAATCTACESLLLVLQTLAHTGNDNFDNVIIGVCEAAGVEDDDVCQGAITLEGPILAHDLRQLTVGSRTSQLFCLTLFGLCPWPDVEPYTVDVTPKPANAVRPAVSGETPIEIVHISDIHVDRFYEVGASYNCTKNICCRPYTAADAPGNTSYPAGEYGNVHCDSPVSLEQSLYSAVESLVPNRTFTIFTGDVVEGAVWEVKDTEVGEDLNDAYGLMQGLGQVYAAVGNHDSCPVNSFPPAAVDTTITTQWAYNNLSTDWETWIGSTAASSVASNFGQYSVVDKTTGLRIISMNTNFWYKQNFWLYETTMERDPSGALAWLVSELEAAESSGERVWLLGHMPLGTTDVFHDQSQYFDQIIQRFDGTISALFFGHTHKDEFEIAYSDYTNQAADTATMVSYIAPALTPTSGNPTFRVYSVDPVTFAILDFTVYYTNISSPSYQNGPTWEPLYSVKDAYGSLLDPPVTDPTAELIPDFWHNVTVLFENNDSVFQDYYARKSRDYNRTTCDGDCKTSEICQLRAAQAQYDCGTVTPGINFKRDITSMPEANGDTCDHSKVVPVLSSVSTNGLDQLRSALVTVMGESWLNTTVAIPQSLENE